MRRYELRGLIVFSFVIVATVIISSLIINRFFSHPKQEEFEVTPKPTISTEIPDEVKELMKKIQEINIAIKSKMDEISEIKCPKEDKRGVRMSVNILYTKALREGMDNGRDLYSNGKISEEELMIQMKKAEKIMNEELEKADKGLQQLKAAPRKGGFNFLH